MAHKYKISFKIRPEKMIFSYFYKRDEDQETKIVRN